MDETGEIPAGLDDLVAAVGYWRAVHQSAERQIQALEQELLVKHADLYHARTQARHELETVEEDLRRAVVNTFNETNNRKPHPACGIRMVKRLQYDPIQVTDWARIAAPMFLVLDVKAFEKVALNLPGAPVAMLEVPSASIATNLAPWTAALGDGA